jgi:hypothetical protein
MIFFHGSIFFWGKHNILFIPYYDKLAVESGCPPSYKREPESQFGAVVTRFPLSHEMIDAHNIVV